MTPAGYKRRNDLLTAERRPDGILHIRADGQLTTENYAEFVPQFERLAEPSSRILIKLGPDFTGWTGPAVWRDLKFDGKHGDQFGRIAVIGDRKWEKWGEASDPIIPDEMSFFELDRRDQAEARVSASSAGGKA